MIIEGFEIDHWSCLKRIAVDDLPSTGVIVLHGPNGTGKSSIVAALRACLLDYPSTSASKELKRWFPKDSTEKPRVSVTFRVGGTCWRITKQFGTKVSKLERRTAAGAWSLEKSTAADAHEQTRALVGGKSSQAGLQQLLWLTQAEFHLPNPKDFDADVQSQLRGVLGVLQTPLDDRFLRRVKDEWCRWFGIRNKPGEKPKLKKDCSLDRALAELKRQRDKLAEIEAEYQTFERMTDKSRELQVLGRELRRQLAERTRARDLLQLEYETSLKRLEAHRRAEERVATAAKTLADAHAVRKKRADGEQRLQEVEKQMELAGREVEETGQRLVAAEQKLRECRRELQGLDNVRRELQACLNDLNERRQLRSLKEQLQSARENLRRAELTTGDLEDLKKEARERPAPDASGLKKLEDNRARANLLRADVEAAAIALTLVPDLAAATACLAIDGAPAVEANPAANGFPIRCSVRRQAEIVIPGWGRAELMRGSDARSLDQVEGDLNELDRQFAEELAPFGLVADDPTTLDQLRSLAAHKRMRDPEMRQMQEEINRLAPRGVDSLRQEVCRLEQLLGAKERADATPPDSNGFPANGADLEQLADQLNADIRMNDDEMSALQGQVQDIEWEIDGAPDGDLVGARMKLKPAGSPNGRLGLRAQDAAAKEQRVALEAAADVRRAELDRLLTAEQIERAIQEAEQAVSEARIELEAAKLSENEVTIRERLDSATAGLRALQTQLAEADKEFHEIKGAMSQTEGLHQKRAAAAARYEELCRQTERETLESEAYHRLYTLFEECREKQLGSVMGPIHDRVLRWMRLLRIGTYQSIRFNDQFLPEKLIAGDGASELLLGEESTGTIEQIALMVRLALGATLSTPAEPVVAMLDDPLTHSDVVRLDLMRAVLKSATAGDNSSTPPAGPLQILVFTCHPEWFVIEGAKIIDLSKVLQS
jgi:hypothetical protein